MKATYILKPSASLNISSEALSMLKYSKAPHTATLNRRKTEIPFLNDKITAPPFGKNPSGISDKARGRKNEI
jgi:hypothetical protein